MLADAARHDATRNAATSDDDAARYDAARHDVTTRYDAARYAVTYGDSLSGDWLTHEISAKARFSLRLPWKLAWGNCLPGKLPPRENSAGVRLFTDLVDFYRSGGANGSKRSFLWL